MSIVKVSRVCLSCGVEFKVRAELGVNLCFGCGQVAARAAEAEHAAVVEAMPVPAWAEGDPFVGLDGGELAAYSNHGKWSKGVRL